MRTPVSVLTATLLTGVLAVSVPAGASTGAARVTARSLPTVAQVADIYPGVRGGGRQVDDYDEIAVPTQDCLTTESSGRADDGKAATFRETDQGQPSTALLDYGTAARARAVLARLRTYARECRGRHASPDGQVAVEVQPFRVDLADEALGLRLHVTYGDGGPGAEVWSVQVVARSGDRLVAGSTSSGTGSPARASVVRLARLQLRTSS